MKKQWFWRFGTIGIGLSLAAVLIVGSPALAVLDSPVDVVPKILFSGDGTLSPAACVYKPDLNGFFTACYGGSGSANPQSIRLCFPDNDTGTKYASVADYTYFYLSPDPLGGLCDTTNYTGTIQNFGMTLNPAPVTINGIPYDAYSVGVLVTASTSASVVKKNGVARTDITKILYFYDLRRLRAPTTALPDYANALDGDGNLIGALGQTDWNDAFSAFVNLDNITGAVGAPATTYPNIGRNPVWASDSKAVYFCVSTSTLGGIWKANTQVPAGSAGAVSRLFRNEAMCTPTVIPTSARKFNAATIDGDQILFRGDNYSSNIGGICYLVDNGTTVAGPYNLFTSAQLAPYMEQNGYYNARTANTDGSDPGTDPTYSFAFAYSCSDSQGNLYFADQSSGTTRAAIWNYDTVGRLYAVNNRNQSGLFVNNFPSPGNVNATNPVVRQIAYTKPDNTTMNINQVLFVCTATKSEVGINDFGGDLNRDGAVDITDYNLLESQIVDHPIRTYDNGLAGTSKKYYEAPSVSPSDTTELFPPSSPTPYDNPEYVDYLKCDFNGNGLVTSKDLQIFTQFFGSTISGTVTLSDYTGNLEGVQVTIEVFPNGSVTAIVTQTVTLDASGQYAFSVPQSGLFDIAAKASHWLKSRQNGVTLNGMANTVNLTLTNGDTNDDNAVNATDLSAVLAALDTSTSGPTDLDGSGEVDSTDLAIVLTNMDMAGS